MSKTLFWYLLKDLLRIFFLAAGTLAGIMSFGALLRPLTQHGLNASQVGKILSYFSPAMTTYSLPVAALFATTFVYGRVSADNELTACRASGISHLAMTWPATLLGLLVALISLLFLSFVVPNFTLKVEKVIYSNLAQLIATKITRTHEISYGKTTIFAQGANVINFEHMVIRTDDPELAERVRDLFASVGQRGNTTAEGLVFKYDGPNWRSVFRKVLEGLPEGDRDKVKAAWTTTSSDAQSRQEALAHAKPLADALGTLPPYDAQVVDLYSPMIFTYAAMEAPDVKAEREATGKDKDKPPVRMSVPAKVWIAKRATAYITHKGDGVELEAVLSGGANFPRGLGGSQTIIEQAQFGPAPMGSPIRENTKFMDIRQLKEVLTHPENSKRLSGMVQQFIRDEQRQAYYEQIKKSLTDPNLRSYRFTAETETLILYSPDSRDLKVEAKPGGLIVTPSGEERVRVDRESNGQVVSSDLARQVRVVLDPVEPLPDSPMPRRMIATIRGYDVVVQADEDPAPHETFPRSINLPMPADLQEMESHTVQHYLGSRSPSRAEQDLAREHDKLLASIISEMHSRASFAVSCFILVMVGAALGMISRSGNFLSAFAVSVVPALLCIALIVTGQHVCEGTPKNMRMGLSLVWSGNVIVLILAVFLLGKLQRE